MRDHVSAFGTARVALAAAAVLLAAAGCGNHTTSPIASTTIVGDFGGPTAKLHADSAGAMIELGCASVTVATPLETDASGKFEVAGTERSTAGAVPVNPPPGAPVSVDGLALTDGVRRIRIIIRQLEVDRLGPSDTLLVTEGQPGNFPVCL